MSLAQKVEEDVDDTAAEPVEWTPTKFLQALLARDIWSANMSHMPWYRTVSQAVAAGECTFEGFIEAMAREHSLFNSPEYKGFNQALTAAKQAFAAERL